MQANARLLQEGVYTLHPCYNANNKPCGCWQPLKKFCKPITGPDGKELQGPQCTAHGYDPKQGVTQVVDELRAQGVQHRIALEWPCMERPGGKRQGRSKRGRFTKRPDAFVDVVLLDAQGVVIRGLEVNGREHDSTKGRKNDKRKEATVGFDLMFETAERAKELAATTAKRFRKEEQL